MSAPKSFALVTCLYDLAKRGSSQHRTVDGMLASAGFVLDQERELVVFCDPELEAELLRRRTLLGPIRSTQMLIHAK